MNVKELFYSPDFLNKRAWQPRDPGVALDWQSQSRVPGGHSGGGQWTATESWTPVSKMKHVKSLGGTTGAELYEDEKGRRFVVKKGASEEHARNEFEANRLYDQLGVDVPESQLHLVDGKKVLVTRFIEGKQFNELTPAEQALAREKIKKDFAADALLGNWDVTGANGDNIIVDKHGTPWRVDNGGAMAFRAQGGPKGLKWNAELGELASMREQGPAGQMFKGLTNKDVEAQAEALAGKLDASKLKDPVLAGRLIAMSEMGEGHKPWPWQVKTAALPAVSTPSLPGGAAAYKAELAKLKPALSASGMTKHQVEQAALMNSLKKDKAYVSWYWHKDHQELVAKQYPGKAMKVVEASKFIKKELGVTTKEVKNASPAKLKDIFSVTASEKAIAVGAAKTVAQKAHAEALHVVPAKPATFLPSEGAPPEWKRAKVENGDHIAPAKSAGNWASIRDAAGAEYHAKLTTQERHAVNMWKGSAKATREAMVAAGEGKEHPKAGQAVNFASACDKAPQFVGVTYRGVGHILPGTKYYHALQQPGNVVELEAHACSSRRSVKGAGFAGSTCLLRVAGRTGAAIESTGGHQDEAEVVLKRGTRYRVVGAAHDVTAAVQEDNVIKRKIALFVDLEEVHESTPATEKLALSLPRLLAPRSS